MEVIQQQQKNKFTWSKFFSAVNSLRWYDLFTSFIFRFMAKTSEPLLAAGVIVSAIDFLQRGELLANNPSLSLWWSVAQGVAMEVSVGPVLVLALDANEEGDKVKALLYAGLSATLALVGGAMLFMQFGLSVGGLHENQISPFVVWPLFALRTIASIGYIALSCTKHKRFSGVSPKAIIAETNRTFEDAMKRLGALHEQAMTSVNETMERVSERVANSERTAESSLANMQAALSYEFGVRLESLQRTFASELSSLKSSLDEQAKLMQRTSERMPSELRQFQAPKLLPKVSVKSETGFDKKKFVLDYLAEHPEMSGVEIQRRAKELGYSISGGYISEIKNERTTSEHEAIRIEA